MKRLVVTAAAIAGTLFAQAQTAGNIPGVTALEVKVTAVRTAVASGPYARFAQKYFGAIAPLTDKTAWTLESAAVGVLGDCPRGGTEAGTARAAFPKVPADRLAAADVPLEQAAREAARTVYALRKHRADILTGQTDYAEIGGGTAALLEGIDRMEREYLALFFGTQVSDTLSAAYAVVPEKGRNTYIICRFSDAAGLLPASDLGGQPVTLDVRLLPQPEPQLPEVRRDRNGRPAEAVATVSIPAVAECAVYDGKRELGRSAVRIEQLGRQASVPAGK